MTWQECIARSAREDAEERGRPKPKPVTDPDLDAPDGAVIDGWRRVGDQWMPPKEKGLKRKTNDELEGELHDMRAYQEAFWALNRGEKPKRIKSGPHEVMVLGVDRMAGGVVLFIDDDGKSSCVRWAETVLPNWERGGDPYWREIGGTIRRMQKAAAEGRR